MTLNHVHPGAIATDRIYDTSGWLEAAEEGARERIPAGRLGTVEEFAAAAVFLCSVPAGYIAGTSLLVDGGASRSVSEYPQSDSNRRSTAVKGRRPRPLDHGGVRRDSRGCGEQRRTTGGDGDRAGRCAGGREGQRGGRASGVGERAGERAAERDARRRTRCWSRRTPRSSLPPRRAGRRAGTRRRAAAPARRRPRAPAARARSAGRPRAGAARTRARRPRHGGRGRPRALARRRGLR